jgi:hypothetical protein
MPNSSAAMVAAFASSSSEREVYRLPSSAGKPAEQEPQFPITGIQRSGSRAAMHSVLAPSMHTSPPRFL